MTTPQRLGVTMINMYCNMIEEKFKEVLHLARLKDSAIRQEAILKAAQANGLKDLMDKRGQLQKRLNEIKDILSGWEENRHNNGKYCKRIEEEADQYMPTGDSQVNIVQNACERVKEDIKLSGLSGDVQKIFTQLPATLRSLEKKLKI